MNTKTTKTTKTPAPASTKIPFLRKIRPEQMGGIENTVIFRLQSGLEVQCDASKLPENAKNWLLLHGISQKVGDAVAGIKDEKTAFARMQSVVDNLEAGNLTAQAGSGHNDLVLALMSIYNKPASELDEFAAKIALMDEEKIKEISKHQKVKAKILEIRAERAKKSLGEDLDGLNDLLEEELA